MPVAARVPTAFAVTLPESAGVDPEPAAIVGRLAAIFDIFPREEDRRRPCCRIVNTGASCRAVGGCRASIAVERARRCELRAINYRHVCLEVLAERNAVCRRRQVDDHHPGVEVVGLELPLAHRRVVRLIQPLAAHLPEARGRQAWNRADAQSALNLGREDGLVGRQEQQVDAMDAGFGDLPEDRVAELVEDDLGD